MAFDLRSTAYGFSHLLLGLRRLIFQQKSDLYICRYRERLAGEGLEMQPLSEIELGTSNGADRCPLCGFALVRVSRPGGYAVETCSAFQFKPFTGESRLSAWLAGLASEESQSAFLKGGRAGAQDSYNRDSCATDEQSSRA